MARRTKNDWILGINEIRRLMPHWPEEMVQDYFHKGFEDETNLPVDHLFMGPTHTDTCRDVEPTDGNVPIYNGETGLWCPGSLDEVDPCFCFEIPEQECEDIVGDCEALDDFFAKNGAPGALFITRNYDVDLDESTNPTLGSGTMQSAIAGLPDGEAELMLIDISPSIVDLDTCGETVTQFSGGSEPVSQIVAQDVGDINNMTFGMLIRPNNGSFGTVTRAVFQTRAGSPTTIRYGLSWHPTNGTLEIWHGSSLGTSPDAPNRSRLSISGPSGYNADETPRWVLMFIKISREGGKHTITAKFATDSQNASTISASKSTNDDGGALSSSSWWDLSESTDNITSFGGTFFYGSFRGTKLFTSLYQDLPSDDYVKRLYFELRRNSVGFDDTYDCEDEGPPPIIGGSIPRFDDNTGTFELGPVLPPIGDDSQYLKKSISGPYFAEWTDLPTVGGTTGQQLVKASDAKNDLTWVDRDARTFESASDPSVSQTVLPGDFWLQGGVG